MDNKVKVPGGAFYAGDGLTVDPVTRTVSAGGGSGGGGVFRVNLTLIDNENNQYSADKTFAEIVAAYKGGMEVEAVTVESADGLELISIYQLAAINGLENLIVFASTGSMMGGWYIFEATMGADGVVSMTSKKVS